MSTKRKSSCTSNAPLTSKAGPVSRQNAHKGLTHRGPTDMYDMPTGAMTYKVHRDSLCPHGL